MYDEALHCVGLAPTMEPMAAVNLEYLSVALKVPHTPNLPTKIIPTKIG